MPSTAAVGSFGGGAVDRSEALGRAESRAAETERRAAAAERELERVRKQLAEAEDEVRVLLAELRVRIILYPIYLTLSFTLYFPTLTLSARARL